MPQPPKAKLYNKCGKMKIIEGIGRNSNNLSQDQLINSHSIASGYGESQFELELCWCIQQLESSLSSGKLNEKQVQTTTKTLKILKNSNQCLIKKRQIMRATFGDYRSKMNEEEKQLSLGSKQIKFDTKPKSKNKSYFLKKSAILNTTGDKHFRFNFDISQGIEYLNISGKNSNNNDSIDGSKKDNVHKPEFHTTASENNFKFNFDIK